MIIVINFNIIEKNRDLIQFQDNLWLGLMTLEAILYRITESGPVIFTGDEDWLIGSY